MGLEPTFLGFADLAVTNSDAPSLNNFSDSVVKQQFYFYAILYSLNLRCKDTVALCSILLKD